MLIINACLWFLTAQSPSLDCGAGLGDVHMKTWSSWFISSCQSNSIQTPGMYTPCLVTQCYRAETKLITLLHRYQCPRPTVCARPDRIPTATKSQCQWSHLALWHITDRTQSTVCIMRLSVKMCLVMLVIAVLIFHSEVWLTPMFQLMVGVQVEALDFGSSGVWDSPLATDYWVKRFGFMWAGGRSGMHGLKALQVGPSTINKQQYIHTPMYYVLA